MDAESKTSHEGRIVYHCRRCDTHVSIRVEELNGRDITRFCLCGRGTLTRENGEPVALSPTFAVKACAASASAAGGDAIARREAADREKRKQRSRQEWKEFDS